MVIVFGSVNLDLSVAVQQAPRAGETVLGGALLTDGGGKGANQAHAARRYGAQVALVGAVGDDALGATALASLERAGVRLDALRRVPGVATGAALITLDVQGENRIVVAPGANAAACADDVPDADLAQARVVLLQLEVPFEQSRRLARRARAHGCRVMLNAAPVTPGWQPDLADIDVVIVNRIELHQLADSLRVAPGAPATRAQALARSAGCEVLLTLGAYGAMLATLDGSVASMNGHAVPVRDTTGAGDTFAGVFAAACAGGQDTMAALRAANAAAALCCGARGAQAAQPDRAAIDAFLQSSDSPTKENS
jgi:ribokinase